MRKIAVFLGSIESGKMEPIRVQRKRVKGFKLPENTVCVTRGTKYGNPFRVVQVGKEWQVKCSSVSDRKQAQIIVLNCRFIYKEKNEAITDAVKCFKIWLPEVKLDISFLKGKNIACWCSLDKPCHADVLLEKANQ